MTDSFIDRLCKALRKGSGLTGTDIDSRYYHDLAGNRSPSRERSSVQGRRKMSHPCFGSVTAKKCQ